MSQAVHALQTTGRVRLTGAPALRSSVRRGLYSVLLVLVAVLGVGGLAVVIGAALAGARFTAASVAGLFSALALLAGGFVLLVRRRHRQGRYVEAERLPIEIDARGLTVRGVGPVPWHHLQPAQYDLIRSESDNAYERRAISYLTQPGLVAVNQQLPPEARLRLGPPYGLVGDRHHRWVDLPSAEGISEPEMIELLNWARQSFLGLQPAGPPLTPRRRLPAAALGLVVGVGVAVVLLGIVLVVVLRSA